MDSSGNPADSGDHADEDILICTLSDEALEAVAGRERRCMDSSGYYCPPWKPVEKG
jgi:hypothetical protein